MNYQIISIILLSPAATSAATTLPDTATITRRVEYLDQHHRRLKSADGAAFRVETVLADSVRGIEKVYTLPSGKLYSFQAFLNRKPRVPHGAYLEYYENGKMRLQESYVLGNAQGPRVLFYPSGQVKRREQVLPNGDTQGACFGPDGQPVAYFPYREAPEYPGGQDALIQDLKHNLVYPHGALRAHLEGRVVVMFRVNMKGRPEDIRLEPLPANTDADIKHVYSFLQEEAVQAVRKLKSFTPGRLDGQPAELYYKVPVTFMLE